MPCPPPSGDNQPTDEAEEGEEDSELVPFGASAATVAARQARLAQLRSSGVTGSSAAAADADGLSLADGPDGAYTPRSKRRRSIPDEALPKVGLRPAGPWEQGVVGTRGGRGIVHENQTRSPEPAAATVRAPTRARATMRRVRVQGLGQCVAVQRAAAGCAAALRVPRLKPRGRGRWRRWGLASGTAAG